MFGRGPLTHTLPLPDSKVCPGPWIRTNQIMKAPAQIAAVTAKIRPEDTRALVIAGGAAHQDPHLVELSCMSRSVPSRA